MQLARASIGGVAVYTVLLVAVISYREMSSSAGLAGGVDRAFLICAAFAILAPGVVLKFRAMSLLREGVRQHRWHETELDALRQQVDRPVWTAAAWLMFGVVLCSPLLLPLHSPAVWLFVWMPASLIFELRNAVRKPDPWPREMIDWSTARRLESEHWGRGVER